MTKIFNFTGYNTNSSSVHFIINRNTMAKIPGYMLSISPEQFVNKLIEHVYSTYEVMLDVPNMGKNKRSPYSQSQIDEYCSDFEEANIRVPVTNGRLNFEAVLFLIDILLKEQPVFIEDHDNVYAYRKVGIRENDFHRLDSLFRWMRNETLNVKKIDNNTYVFYTRGRKWVVQRCDEPVHRPIMADIKITNRCSRACSYCYQRSTKDGEHCSFETLKNFIENNPQIVEVAIGGGEPTEHPQFEEILKWLQEKEIIVNFTTRNKEYLLTLDYSYEDFFEEQENGKRLFGAVGFSVDHPKEIFEKREFFDSLKVPISVHVILWPSVIDWLMKNKEKMFDIFFSNEYIKNISQIVFLFPKVTHPSIMEFLRNDSREIISSRDKFGLLKENVSNFIWDEEIMKFYRTEMDKLFNVFTVKNSYSTKFAFDTPCLAYFSQDALEENGAYTYQDAVEYIEGGLACYYDATTNQVFNNSYEKIPMKIF